MPSAIEEEYEALLQFLYIAPIGLVQLRCDGEIVMVNPLCAQLLMPLSRDGSLANLFVALEEVAPDLRHRAENFAEPSGAICDGLHLHVGIGRSGRREAQVLSLSLLKLDTDRLMAVLSDVTQNVRRERELRQSQAWIHTLVTGMTDYALVALDAKGYFREWNPGVERVTGFGKSDIEGQTYAMFYPPDAMSGDRARDRLHEADRSGWSLDEGWRLRADGSRYWGSCLIAPMREPDEAIDSAASAGSAGSAQDGGAEESPPGEHAYSLIIRDISERREASDAIRRSLWCDHLTGLSNRRVLFEAMEIELHRWARAPRPLSVVMFDADHFKQINDRHGHAAGDAVLRRFATAMTANFRPIDVVARLGGEEFVALMPGADAEAAAAAAQRLCDAVRAQTVTLGDKAIHYTVSAGVAWMEEGVAGVEALLQRADTAMYAAKALGRDRVERWRAPGG